jgi:MerR HTH family regulatory protein
MNLPLVVSEMAILSREEVAMRCGVDVAFVEQLTQLGVIEASPGAEGFACEVTLRVGRFVRLQRDLGVNLEGAAVIVELLERLDTLELELSALRRR